METHLIIGGMALIGFLIWPLTTVLHELGHGIPSLIFTKEKVIIYIGTYGNIEKTITFHLGKLQLFIKYNPLLWKKGLCVFNSSELNILQKLLIFLAGPIASLLISVLFFYITLTVDLHGAIKLVSFIFIISSLIDFLMNIIPNKSPILLESGNIVYNDGQKLKLLLKYRVTPADFERAIDLFNKKNYKESAYLIQKILDAGTQTPTFYKLGISAYLINKNYEKAELLNLAYSQYFTLDSNDLVNSGLIKSRLEDHNSALEDYIKALELDPNNLYALNNLGYTYALLEKYEQALLVLNTALEINPEYSFSYSNRGFTKIKLGDMEAGLADIETAIILDNTNSYAFRNLGIYYYETGNNNKALENFKIAKELDSETHLLKDYIEKVKKELTSI